VDLYMFTGFTDRDVVFCVAFNDLEAWDFVLTAEGGLHYLRDKFPIMRKLAESECLDINGTEMYVEDYLAYWPQEGIVTEEIQLCP